MKKDILAVFAIILIVAAVINGTHIQSVDEYYLTHIDDITSESETVKCIRCDTILDNTACLPMNLFPPRRQYSWETSNIRREGRYSFDIWDRAVRWQQWIQLEFQGQMKTWGSV